MKCLPFIFFLYTGVSAACTLSPQNLIPNVESGFVLKETDSLRCEHCSLITINAPIIYEKEAYSHAIFTVFLNGKLISKSATYLEDNSKVPIFYSIISKSVGVTYEVNLLYGSGWCKSYQFDYASSKVTHNKNPKSDS